MGCAVSAHLVEQIIIPADREGDFLEILEDFIECVHSHRQTPQLRGSSGAAARPAALPGPGLL